MRMETLAIRTPFQPFAYPPFDLRPGRQDGLRTASICAERFWATASQASSNGRACG